MPSLVDLADLIFVRSGGGLCQMLPVDTTDKAFVDNWNGQFSASLTRMCEERCRRKWRHDLPFLVVAVLCVVFDTSIKHPARMSVEEAISYSERRKAHKQSSVARVRRRTSVVQKKLPSSSSCTRSRQDPPLNRAD